jgi:hypothetical protein
MSTAFTKDSFNSTHTAQTDLQNMEDNMVLIRNNFANTSAPVGSTGCQFWADTTNHLLKIRSENNSAWYSVWDMSNNKPVISGLSGEITDTMVSTVAKDGDATRACMRTLGTAASQAMAGNDARISGYRYAALYYQSTGQESLNCTANVWNNMPVTKEVSDTANFVSLNGTNATNTIFNLSSGEYEIVHTGKMSYVVDTGAAIRITLKGRLWDIGASAEILKSVVGGVDATGQLINHSIFNTIGRFTLANPASVCIQTYMGPTAPAYMYGKMHGDTAAIFQTIQLYKLI